MDKKTKDLLVQFMNFTFYSLFPDYFHADTKEMERLYAEIGDEGDEWSKFPTKLCWAFLMKKAIDKFARI